MRLLTIIFVLSFSFLQAVSQTDGISWLSSPSYDFGIIKEEGGDQIAEFKFVNNSGKKIEIYDVKVSCGCTTVNYPKGKIAKGDTATIQVSYDPFERPGKFQKDISIYLSHKKRPETLEITGTVLASPETLALFYPNSFGNLNFDTLNPDFGEIRKGRKRREFVDIYKSGTTLIIPSFFSKDQAITWVLEPPEIKPGETSTLTIYLDTSQILFTGEKYFIIDAMLEDENIASIKAKALVLPNIDEIF